MKYLYVLLCLAISCMIFVSVKFYLFKKDTTFVINETYQYIQLYNLLEGRSHMLYKYENSKIDDFVVMDINNIEYKFSMLIGNERKLIFKYNKSNCISCIDSELNNFIAMSDKFGIDNMVILGEHDNIRELNAFLEERKCEINAYLIKSESGSISHILSEENLPFVFMIDSRLVAECVFIPIKEIADYSESYYKNIYNRFFVEALPAF